MRGPQESDAVCGGGGHRRRASDSLDPGLLQLQLQLASQGADPAAAAAAAAEDIADAAHDTPPPALSPEQQLTRSRADAGAASVIATLARFADARLHASLVAAGVITPLVRLCGQSADRRVLAASTSALASLSQVREPSPCPR
jgi:hypothetical protein